MSDQSIEPDKKDSDTVTVCGRFTSTNQLWRSIRSPDWKRKEKTRKLLLQHELIPLIDLYRLEQLAITLGIESTFMWIEYVELMLDLRLELKLGKLPTRSRIEDLEHITESLVRHLDRDQLIRMRFFYSCLDQKNTENNKYTSKVDKSTGNEVNLYSCESDHDPDYYIALSVYDLTKIDHACANDSYDDGYIKIKFYGSHEHEANIYESVEILVSQVIDVIEQQNKKL